MDAKFKSLQQRCKLYTAFKQIAPGAPKALMLQIQKKAEALQKRIQNARGLFMIITLIFSMHLLYPRFYIFPSQYSYNINEI
jgi:hypothetical protein